MTFTSSTPRSHRVLRHAAPPRPDRARRAAGAARHHGASARGPASMRREKAIQGLPQSPPASRWTTCEQRETPKGPVWFAVRQEQGRETPGRSRSLTEMLPAGAQHRRLLAQVHALGRERHPLGPPHPLHPLPAGRCGGALPLRRRSRAAAPHLGHRFLSLQGRSPIGRMRAAYSAYSPARAYVMLSIRGERRTEDRERRQGAGRGRRASRSRRTSGWFQKMPASWNGRQF